MPIDLRAQLRRRVVREDDLRGPRAHAPEQLRARLVDQLRQVLLGETGFGRDAYSRARCTIANTNAHRSRTVASWSWRRPGCAPGARAPRRAARGRGRSRSSSCGSRGRASGRRSRRRARRRARPASGRPGRGGVRARRACPRAPAPRTRPWRAAGAAARACGPPPPPSAARRVAIGEKPRVRGCEERVGEGVAHVGDGLAHDGARATPRAGSWRSPAPSLVGRAPLAQARSARAHGPAGGPARGPRRDFTGAALSALPSSSSSPSSRASARSARRARGTHRAPLPASPRAPTPRRTYPPRRPRRARPRRSRA